MAAEVRVVVADGQRLFREGVEAILRGEPQFSVIEGSDSADALVALVARDSVDVALVDVEIPGPPAIDLLHRLRAIRPELSVVMLAMHVSSALAAGLVDAGAAAVLTKMVGRQTLLRSVHAAASLSTNAVIVVVRSPLPREARELPHLTGREREVLHVVAEGRSNREIASHLGLSVSTVKRHLSNIYAKVDATSRVEALVKARVPICHVCNPAASARVSGWIPQPSRPSSATRDGF